MKRILLCTLMLALAGMSFADTFYVAASAGAHVYKKPSTHARLLTTLAFGDRVETLPYTVPKAAKNQKEEWVALIIENMSYDTCYILKSELHTDRHTIPQHALYYYYSLYINSGQDYFDISYSEKTSPWERSRDGDTTLYGYNDRNVSEPRVDKRFKRLEYVPEGITDTLRSYLKLELVDIKDYKRKKTKNKYAIDTTHVEKDISVYPRPYRFSLPVNNGKSSMIVASDSTGEAQYSRGYVGQIPYLNKYLIQNAWEDTYYTLYDRTTGALDTLFASGGLPYISPDGKCMLGIGQSFSYQDDEACELTLAKLDSKLHIKSRIIINFKSWLPDLKINSAFWISDRELIMKVYSVMNLRDDPQQNHPNQYHYQYIKVTIL